MEFDESDIFLNENYIIESNISEIIYIDILDNSSKQKENITEDDEIFKNLSLEENFSIKENLFIKENINTELDNKKKLKSIVHNHFTLNQEAKKYKLTAYWISNNWQLQHCTLEFSYFEGSHLNKNLAEEFFKILKENNLLTKILDITTDNAKNMNSIFNNLEENFNNEDLEFDSKNQYIYCLTHIINLSVQEILKSLYNNNNNNESNNSDEDNNNEITNINNLGALGKV
ncbi:9874_t:CDS:2 [Scutellospora calospora]|uniref:9874_t:CDS:1 n=1 Tax=Scutellospora calospora TaxID=85575 RepID=A0ACA9KI47_9GLOM|nr:9874_t:CDS:2 [Scutellospora calospora]